MAKVIQYMKLDFYFADSRFPDAHYLVQALTVLEHIKECKDDCGAIGYYLQVLSSVIGD